MKRIGLNFAVIGLALVLASCAGTTATENAATPDATQKQDTDHQCHKSDGHKHGKGCGHKGEKHGDHTDYLHDGHKHAEHMDHYDDHGATCHEHAEHTHQHGPNCGHKTVKHADHVDYIHEGHRHAGHGTHYDEHADKVSRAPLSGYRIR